MDSNATSPIDLGKAIRETFVADGEVWDTVDSTNNRAKEIVGRFDLPLPYLITAELQTAGRGRGTRRWWTGPGSLAFSLIVSSPVLSLDTSQGSSPERENQTTEGPAGQTSKMSAPREPLVCLVGLLGALSVCRAVVPLVPPGVPCGLHWPNDVYVAGRKLAGVLVEAAANERAILGIGVNVNNLASEAPEHLRPFVISLRDLCGTCLDRTHLLVTIIREIEMYIERLTRDASQLTREADQLCLQKGRELILETEKREYRGICLGVDVSGALLLETAEGVQKFVSGTVRGNLTSNRDAE